MSATQKAAVIVTNRSFAAIGKDPSEDDVLQLVDTDEEQIARALLSVELDVEDLHNALLQLQASTSLALAMLARCADRTMQHRTLYAILAQTMAFGAVAGRLTAEVE